MKCKLTITFLSSVSAIQVELTRQALGSREDLARVVLTPKQEEEQGNIPKAQHKQLALAAHFPPGQ